VDLGSAQSALFRRRRRAPELQPERPSRRTSPSPCCTARSAALERDLKAPLFERDKPGARLSPAGQAFLDDARALLSAADAARRRVAGTATGARTFTVGFMPA
jgi:DNA-binding transcriptional LysR family regulator